MAATAQGHNQPMKDPFDPLNTKQHQASAMPTGWKIVFGFVALIILGNLFGTKSTTTTTTTATTTESMASKYPGPWSSDFNLNISKALVKHNASGCGELWHRAAKDSSTEHLVYCTPSGTTWTAYLVWESSGDVIGPLKTAPDIPPPK